MKRVRRWLPSFLLVLPSIILVGVFVYGFIGKTVFEIGASYGSRWLG